MPLSKNLNLYLLTFNCGREIINPDVFASHLFTALPATSKTQGHSTATNVSSETSTLPDIIVLNLQEISPIAYGFLGGSFVTPYLDRFRDAVNIAANRRSKESSVSHHGGDESDVEYFNIRAETAGLTSIMVFVRSDLVGHVQNLQVASVGVGVQEMGNKGAVGVRVDWRLSTGTDLDSNDDTDEDNEPEIMGLTFVSAHLAPMEDQLERRNQDYKDIVRGLVFTEIKQSSKSSKKRSITNETEEDAPLLQGLSEPQSPNTSSKNLTGIYAPKSHLFFAGDLNYRTSSTAPSKSQKETKSHVQTFPLPTAKLQDPTTNTSLLSKDQLLTEVRANRTLHGLHEAPITFAPTYKYHFPTDTTKDSISDDDFEAIGSYSFATHRWPSWCDRIFSSLPLSDLNPSYRSLPLLRTSDHRAVALSVSIPLDGNVDGKFADMAPVSLDGDWTARRDAARRKEIVVGVLSYLILTWEGRVALVAGFVGVFGLGFLIRGVVG